MNAKLFAAVFGASVLMAAPVQAKFIGIAIYDPKVMLPICKNEIAQGRAAMGRRIWVENVGGRG